MTELAEPRVLLLDAQLRHALAIARSLGRRGIRVIAASSNPPFPARYSRYVERSVVLPQGAELAAVLATIKQERIGVIIAAGVPGNALLCRYRDELEPRVSAAFNDLAQFEQLSNKHATLELAASLGVPHPATEQVRDVHDAADVAASIGFPMVFKSPLDQARVAYPQDVAELRRLVSEFADNNPDLLDRGIYPMVQEHVDGDGHGFYGLADRGRLCAYFMHRRLHEVPPSGGPSAMAMGYRDPALLELGERFFSATNWHGVAMVEFKRSRRNGLYYLLEVNPKFWGSLDLSIAAGVDFPFLLHQMLSSKPLDVLPGAYRDATIFRSLTMDLAYAAATRNVRRYLRAFSDRRIDDDLDLSDLLPTVALFAAGVRRVATPSAAASRSSVLASAPQQGSKNGMSADRGHALGPIALRAFYLAKPLIPRPAQVTARRIRAKRIWHRVGCDSRSRVPSQPLEYPWPDGARACALLTHDVETQAGQSHIGALAAIEQAYGVTSCWNFVVRRYPVDASVLTHLRGSGHELGVHGVYHDGKEFSSHARYRERLALMQDAAHTWGAHGFRSPSMIYDLELLKTLPFSWDSSMPAWDPFQPKSGDCHTYTPFLLNDHCVELPVTLWQDFTLFEELRMTDIELWRQQIDAIYSAGGLINVIVHPDYMVAPRRLNLYRALLDHLCAKESLLISTPSEISAWERERAPRTP